jgi:SAM-dependent methyltransferase
MAKLNYRNSSVKIFVRTLWSFGISPVVTINALRGIPSFIQDYFRIKKLMKEDNDFKKIIFSPVSGDRYEQGGDMQSIYFQQDLYVAQHVFKNNPVNHLDIGSRTDGFVAHIATFRNIDIVDIREIKSKFFNINYRQSDMMNPAPSLYDQYDSVSCLHAIEHFGLGRYGDPLDLKGHIKAIENIYKILQSDGLFYFSTPIGPQRIEFNAHRVFDVRYLLSLFKGKFKVESFSYIDDGKVFFPDQELTDINVDANFNCKYGCGIFILRKVK